MGTQSTSGKSTRRRYSPEERAQAVRLVRQLREELGTPQGTVKRVANQLGYGVESVRLWVKQADIDSGDAVGMSTADRAKTKTLEQENRELRRANEILKRASVFFAPMSCWWCLDGFARFFGALPLVVAYPAMCGPSRPSE